MYCSRALARALLKGSDCVDYETRFTIFNHNSLRHIWSTPDDPCEARQPSVRDFKKVGRTKIDHCDSARA
jgi:hypothetical protein